MPGNDTFVGNTLQSEFQPPLRDGGKVHKNMLTCFDAVERLKQRRQGTSHEPQLVRRKDDDRYVQSRETLLIIHLLIRGDK